MHKWGSTHYSSDPRYAIDQAKAEVLRRQKHSWLYLLAEFAIGMVVVLALGGWFWHLIASR